MPPRIVEFFGKLRDIDAKIGDHGSSGSSVAKDRLAPAFIVKRRDDQCSFERVLVDPHPVIRVGVSIEIALQSGKKRLLDGDMLVQFTVHLRETVLAKECVHFPAMIVAPELTHDRHKHENSLCELVFRVNPAT
jgi:hypothetical protein